MTDKKAELQAQLEKEVGPCLASDLMAHLERDAVVIVSDDLQLIHAALAVAEDDADSVQHWITQAKFRKPTEAERETWKSQPQIPFKSVIVRPYVLVQPIPVATGDA